MEKLRLKLDRFAEAIKTSNLVKESTAVFEKYSIGASVPQSTKISSIRCLALGSPSESNAALYQLVYLNELAKYFGVDPENVSLYDPVFNDLDRELLHGYNYTIDESTPVSFAPESTLYYLPHADLKVTEDIILATQPSWFLANWIVSHTESFTKKKLYDEYRIMALLKNSLEAPALGPAASTEHAEAEFTTVKRKKNKNKKNAYVEPKIEYSYDDVYFNQVIGEKLDKIDGVWGNAFSDLAFHRIYRHSSPAR